MLSANKTTFVRGERLEGRFEVKKNNRFQGPWEKAFGHLHAHEFPVSNVSVLLEHLTHKRGEQW